MAAAAAPFVYIPSSDGSGTFALPASVIPPVDDFHQEAAFFVSNAGLSRSRCLLGVGAGPTALFKAALDGDLRRLKVMGLLIEIVCCVGHPLLRAMIFWVFALAKVP
ncbi:hypothetical protein HU200_065922 [Digitaria exilis]|uniref:Uncharacterized protein n=1 Tax=Digitaria exilis TaxID=1010633 RepID=A0A835DUI0_9POAL|nr:hypothetical protein HU200_065922 [Digitaria exilis]